MELSKSELKIVRNKLIKRALYKTTYSISDISQLFNLSEQHLRINILKNEDLRNYNDRENHTIDDLESYKYYLYDFLKTKEYSDSEIFYILHRESLDIQQSHKTTDYVNLYNTLYEENDVLCLEYEKLKSAYKNLFQKNKSLESDNNDLILKNSKLSESVNESQKSLSELEKENDSLKEKLLKSQQTNAKLQDEILSLTKEIENLQRFKESASKYYIEQSEKESEQQLRIHILESDLQEAYKDNNQLKQTNQNLINENSELQSLSSSIIYLQADLTTKDNLIKDLESEIQSLKTEIENLTAPSEETEHEKINSKFERVYTIAQRQQMIDIYYKNHCKRKQSLEAVRAELNISICDRHFVRILEDEGVFKSTYKKRKSIKPKK